MQARGRILLRMNRPPPAPNTLIRPRDLTRTGWTRILFSKVPEVTLLFWLVKVLSTTVGGRAADFLAGSVGLGLPATTAIMSLLLATALIIQFSLRRHVPAAYWLVVVLMSAVGALLAALLADTFGLGQWAATACLTALLLVTFGAWYRVEQTVSIHTIVTRRREAFYWCAILASFALGTSIGDLVGTVAALGVAGTALVFGAALVAVAVACRAGLGAAPAFWAAYVLTQPFGAAAGAALAAPASAGGLGLGAEGTSVLFLVVILAIVSWFTVTTALAVDARTAVRALPQ